MEIFKLSLISLLVSLFTLQVEAKADDKITYKNFTILNKYEKRDDGVEPLYSDLKIFNGKKQVYFKEFEQILIYENSTTNYLHGNIKSLSPFLILESYSGGAHCCSSYDVLDLRKGFKILTTIDSGNSSATIEKIDDEPSFLIKYNDIYAYEWTCFANSPGPELILRYKDNKTSVASNLMKRLPLSDKELCEKISVIKKFKIEGFDYKETNNIISHAQEKYFAATLPIIFKLIYGGNYTQGIEVVDKTWPGNESSRQGFIRSLEKAVRAKKYGSEILSMSGM